MPFFKLIKWIEKQIWKHVNMEINEISPTIYYEITIIMRKM